MTKVYIRYIDDCLECPACDTDQNITRFECRKKGSKFLAWNYVNVDKIEIPEWCPLQDKDFISEQEMKI